ncbi:DMT family transporter [Lacibacterium aquatile]|uniref:DMT family transporter n=1 Tax=Lacibacterium aquatile TaxID=1168082 RepID=A0ABW5DTP0_9PROT
MKAVTDKAVAASNKATLIGGLALVIWPALALLATLAGPIPPFLLTGLAFAVSAIIGIIWWLAKGNGLGRLLNRPFKDWAIGIAGLFGYHLLLFIALQNAPPVEANLLNYLWPLLIVLFSSFLPGERPYWYHWAGAALGLAGTAMLVAGPGLAPKLEYLPGYLAGIGCAVCWAGYSVASRRWCAAVPTEFVIALCGGTAALALLMHLAFEPAYTISLREGLVLLAIGLGPLGAAFFFWDVGIKRGNIRALGAVSYTTPLFSTLLLILFGKGEATAAAGLAAILIVGGAILATRELWSRR